MTDAAGEPAGRTREEPAMTKILVGAAAVAVGAAFAAQLPDLRRYLRIRAM